MAEDPLIQKEDRKKNVIESVSGICNVYSKVSPTDMFAGAHFSEFGADHQSSTAQAVTTNAKDVMKDRFMDWGIDLKWVTLFPHIDDFNGRERGQNFLGSVSCTVDDDSPQVGHREYMTKRWLTMTFCQCKVHEDTNVREICAAKIHDGLHRWTTSLPKERQDRNIMEFAKLIHSGENDALMYRATHQNKCLYYSLLCTDQRLVADHFKLGLYRQVEALACLVHVNGPDKHHQFFRNLLTQKKFPSDVIPSEFIRYCNASAGGSVMSNGKGVHHQPHWMKPYLKAEMLYGLRVLLSIIEDSNSGEISKQEAVRRLKEVKHVGDLLGNHLFAVAIQRGLIVPREFLTQPVVAKTLCNAVRKRLFNGDANMKDERI